MRDRPPYREPEEGIGAEGRRTQAVPLRSPLGLPGQRRSQSPLGRTAALIYELACALDGHAI